MATVTEHRIENGWVLEEPRAAASGDENKPQALESVDKPIENGWVLEEPRAAARPAPDLNFSNMLDLPSVTGVEPGVAPASTEVPAVKPEAWHAAGLVPPAVVGEAIRPRTDSEMVESIAGAFPRPMSPEAGEFENAPQPLPRDVRASGSVTAPPRGFLPKQPLVAAKLGLKNTISGLIGSAISGGTHETREEQQYDPAILDTAIEQGVALGADPLTLATFAVGSAPGLFAARQAAGLLAKRLGPAATLRAIQAAQATGGAATSFALYDAASEALRQGAKREFHPEEIAAAGRRGLVLGGAMGAAGAATLGGPALVKLAAEVGVLASVPPVIQGRDMTVDDWIDAGVLVGTLKSAGKLKDFAKRALEKPAPQRTPVEAQVVANLPPETRAAIAEEALKTASERALERADNLHLGEVVAGGPEKSAQPSEAEALRGALGGGPEAPPPPAALPTALEAGIKRQGVEPVGRPELAKISKAAQGLEIPEGSRENGAEVVKGLENQPPAAAVAGPLRSARELQGGKPEAPGLPQERQAQDRAQMAEAVRSQADQARAQLYQQVPGSFRAFVESQGRRWPIGVTDPGYFALRGQYDDIVKPLYEVRGPRLGNWEIVNRVTGEVEATAPNRVFAQMEANRLDLRRHLPTGGGPARPEITPTQPAPTAEAQPAPAVDTGGPHEFSSTQVDLPERLAGAIKGLAASIPDNLLAEKGREDRPHVTVRFGLHTPEAAPVEKALEGESPARVRLGKLGVFKTPESDVLYADVESPDLVRLNQKLGALPNTETHPEYKPHATIAYLKPGQGAPFVGDARLAGQEATLDTVAFSPKEGGQPAAIRLGATPAVPAPAAPQVPVTPIAGRPGRPAPAPKVPRGTPRQNLPRGQIAAPRQEAPPAAEVSQAFDPGDIDQVARFVRSRGGLAPSPTGDLKGEYAAIPLRFKNRRGLTPDLLAQAMSEAAGRPVEDHEILGMLARSGRLRAEKAERATTEGQAPGRADELDEMRDLPDDVKARRIAAMTGLSEAEAFRMIERQRGAPEAVAQERADRDAAEFQMAARDFFEGHPDERPAPEVLDQPHFERFGGAERVIQDIFGGDRDLATSALETARQDVLEGRVNEERRAYGRIVGEEPTRYEPTQEGDQGLIEGASRRAIPTGKLRPEARQKPVEETPLFQKEPTEEQARLPGVQEGARPYDASRQAPARFLGYQEGGPEPFPLYNVTRDGEEFTYGADTLREQGVEVPQTPTFEDWKAGGRADLTQRDTPSGVPSPEHLREGTMPYGTDTPAFAKWFGGSKVVDAEGRPQVVYRGDYRADLVGSKPDVKKAVSGRFYFTEDPGIASNYATSKEDVHAREAMQDFEKQYTFPSRYGRKRVDLQQLWFELTPEARDRVKDTLLKSGQREDGTMDVSGDHPLAGTDHWQREVRDARGNWLMAGKEVWLNSGTLFDLEDRAKFLDILKAAGIKGGEFDAPEMEASGVTPVFLRITNPLNTGDLPPAVLDRLRAVAKGDRTRERQGGGYDMWDKQRNARVFMERLEEDLAKDTTHAWTSVPEKITQELQKLGYDGIQDTGGKLGGREHTVWIAFEPWQIKSSIGNRGTFDIGSPDIVKEPRASYRAPPGPGEDLTQRSNLPRRADLGEPDASAAAERVAKAEAAIEAINDEIRPHGFQVPAALRKRWAAAELELRRAEAALDKARGGRGTLRPSEDRLATDAERSFGPRGRGRVREPQAPYAPAFFSGLAKLVEDKMPEAAPAAQVQNIVRQGKPDEVKWTGLDDWLRARGGARVTKDEIREFLKQHEVTVEEKVLGGRHSAVSAELADIDRRLTELEQERSQIDREAGGWMSRTPAQTERVQWIDREQDRLSTRMTQIQQRESETGSPKFERLTLPGGREYRELLLTLPPRANDAVTQAHDRLVASSDRLEALAAGLRSQLEEALAQRPFYQANPVEPEWRPTMNNRWAFFQGDRQVSGAFPREADQEQARPTITSESRRDGRIRARDRARTIVARLQDLRGNYPDAMDDARTALGASHPGLKALREEAQRMQDLDQEFQDAQRTAKGATYTSPHWDEKNVLAHIRFNDRTDAGGARVLFLEEIQSDWHQEGRRKGYNFGQRFFVRKPGAETPLGTFDTREAAEAFAREQYDQGTGVEISSVKSVGVVPDAPFAKTWHELALKRVLRYAAEHGYDKVAWTPGDVQNDRYDLAKHIQEIRGGKKDEGYWIEADRVGQPRGDNAIVKSGLSADDLERTIGKEAAQRLIDKIEARQRIPHLTPESIRIRATEDQWLGFDPRSEREIGVGKGTVGSEQEAREYLTNYINGMYGVGGGRNKYATRNDYATLSGLDLKVGGEGMKGFYDRILPEFLNKYGKKWGARVGQATIKTDNAPQDVIDRYADQPDHPFTKRQFAQVPAIDVTPEMKRSVLEEGQALFERRAKYPLRPGVPESTRQQGEQLLLELGAPALRAESMTQRENLPAGQIAAPRRGEEAGSGVRTLGLAIRDDLVRTGRVEMRGQVARTPDDVATLAQVYRDPRYETARIMYVDDAGTVLAMEGISSRLPGSSATFLGEKSRAMYEMWDRMERLGATGYWMIHNHPSGKPTPSSQDERITRAFEERVPGFQGHVVVDSKEYGFILPGQGGNIGTAKLEVDETLLQPRLAHAELGKVVTDPKHVAAIGKAIESPEGFVTLLHRDSNGAVRAIQEMPEAAFMRPDGADYIRGRQRAFGAAETLAYNPHWSMDTWSHARALVIDKTLLDAVTPTGSGIMDRLTPHEQTMRYPQLRLKDRPIRVEEDKAPYGLDPDLAARIAEYGRAHAKEAKDFESWSKRMRDELGPKVEPYLPRAYDQARQGARPAAAAPAPAAPTATTPPPKGPTGPPRAAPSSGDPLKDIDAMARPPAKESWRERLATVKERVLETQVNRFEPLRRLSRALKEKGGRFEPGTEPIEVAEITKNRAMGQSEVFGRRLEAIIKDAHRIGADEDLNRYLTLTQFAKRIRDLSARPESGVTPEGRTQDGGYVNPRQFDQAKVDAGIQSLRQQTGERWPQIEAMAKRVWDLNRQLLTEARDAGLVSQDTYDHIVARGDDYVPMQVLDYLDEVGKAGASPRPFDVRYQDVLKRMEGTERDVRNVLASSYDKGLRVIATVNRNRAARAVGDLAKALPGLVDEVPGDTFKLPEDREVVSAFYDGHRKNFAVPAEIKRSMDFLDDKQIGLIGRVLSQTKRPLQVGATGANLAFAIPNVIRDAKSAMILSKYGVKNPVDLVRFGADWIQGLLHSIKKDALWEEAASQGALFTMQKQISPETFLKSAKGQSSLLEKINLVKHMVHGVEKMNNAMEEATKLASFQRGERFGAPIDELAYEVANYGGSPNFGRSGSWGQELNLLWMFYNARLQGTARTARRLKETPEAAGKMALWRIGALSAVPMLAAWAWNQQWDGDNGMENIPDGDKQRYHVILLPETYRSSTGEERRKYLKIPKEETEQVLGPMLNGFMDWLKGEHPPEAAAIAGDVVGALAPISFDVRGAPSVNHFVRAAASGVLSSANPAVRLPIEVGTNYNAFQQGPLVPRGLAEHVRPTEQARPTTSRTISEIATMLDRVPGAEALGLTSPIKLQHIVTSSTGGAGQSTLDTSDLLLALAKKHLGGIDSRPGTPETVPAWERAGRQAFLSRFMGTGGGAQDREAESRFYDALDAARRVRGSVKLVGKREGRESAEAIKQEERPYFHATKMLETTGKALGRIYRDQIEVTYFSSAPLADREQRLVDLAERRHRLLEKFRTLESETQGFTRTRAEAFP